MVTCNSFHKRHKTSWSKYRKQNMWCSHTNEKIRSCRNFAHATTVVMSGHVQNRGLITSLHHGGQNKRKYSQEFIYELLNNLWHVPARLVPIHHSCYPYGPGHVLWWDQGHVCQRQFSIWRSLWLVLIPRRLGRYEIHWKNNYTETHNEIFEMT